VKAAALAFVIALALLQQTGTPARRSLGEGGRDIESGYRANNRGVALLEQFNYDGAAPHFARR